MLSQHTAVLPSLSTHFPAVSNPPPALGRVCRTKSFLCGNTTNPLLIPPPPTKTPKLLHFLRLCLERGRVGGWVQDMKPTSFHNPRFPPPEISPFLFFGKCCCFPLHTDIHIRGAKSVSYRQEKNMFKHDSTETSFYSIYIFSRNGFSRKKGGKSNMSLAKVKLQYTSKGGGGSCD